MTQGFNETYYIVRWFENGIANTKSFRSRIKAEEFHQNIIKSGNQAWFEKKVI